MLRYEEEGLGSGRPFVAAFEVGPFRFTDARLKCKRNMKYR
jgi:hypothetical protein